MPANRDWFGRHFPVRHGCFPMELRYLAFDYSEDAEGNGLFDAMASVPAARLAAVQDEIGAVLAWAHAHFGEADALEDGGEWTYDLQAQQEYTVAVHAAFDAASSQLVLTPGTAGAPRHAFTLSIGGSPAFCGALRAKFSVD
jgi:hypothetical protein